MHCEKILPLKAAVLWGDYPQITYTRVRKLADGIISAQPREIAEMKAIAELEKRSRAPDAAKLCCWSASSGWADAVGLDKATAHLRRLGR
jgi:hypothetical protein